MFSRTALRRRAKNMKSPLKSLLPSRLEIDAGMLMAAIHNRLWPSTRTSGAGFTR
jgi:hypothetical protein